MEVIFGTTNQRKAQDLSNLATQMGIDLTVRSMADIGWDLGEIDENGNTIEDNSRIKANAIHAFCLSHGIDLPIITDDAGLFVDALGGEPGVKTARYAEEELKQDPSLPKDYVLTKILNNLASTSNRSASYKCCVTCMMPDGSSFQTTKESKGSIATEVLGERTKPYPYAIFVLDGDSRPFNALPPDELKDTYRYNALRTTLQRLSELAQNKPTEDK